MIEKENLLDELKAYDNLLKITKRTNVEDIPSLKERRFFLDRLVLKREGLIAYILPFFITGILFVLGFVSGIYPSPWNSGVAGDAQAAYTFWVLFILFGTYLLNWFVWAIMNIAKEANIRLEIPQEKHNQILSRIFGSVGLIISIFIAIPFIVYDITGFFITEEGWLLDIAYYAEQGDNSWYPGVAGTENGISFGSVLWLVIWIIPWLYFGAFAWLTISLIYYMNKVLKKYEWRDGIHTVIKDRQYRKLLKLSIAAFAPLIPYLVIKLIFQIFYIPWWSDTIATYLLFGFFFIGVAITPFLVTSDIKGDKMELLEKIQLLGNKYFDSMVQQIYENKSVESSDLMKAMLLRIHNQEIVGSLQKKVVDKGMTRKIIIAIIAPVISLIVKFLLGSTLAF
ncbi:MAG: membrane protein of unknown function [Promethearchaeota archaeon]|nr:MAG: membrane protein of unknown function [Candidatus Lokiarchaeota archaeon]